MGKYLDLFPKIIYDPTKSLYSTNYNRATNLLFRIGMLKDYLNNASAYYQYDIQEGDRPEIIAEKVYGDAEAHWIILLANDIVDPQYDWPLGYQEFNNYIIDKYGSVANAKTTIHHYEKVVVREEQATDISFTYRYIIDYDRKTDTVITLSNVAGSYNSGEAIYQGANLAYASFKANVVSWSPGNNVLSMANTVGQIVRYSSLVGDDSSANGIVTQFNIPSVPYDTYLSLADEQSFSTYNVGGKTINETISRNSVSNYDYEVERNESKRSIRIIKSEYYRTILKEFEDLVLPTDVSTYLRTLR